MPYLTPDRSRFVLSLTAPALAERVLEPHDVQNPTTKKCTIVTEKPTDHDDDNCCQGGTTYTTRTEAQNALKDDRGVHHDQKHNDNHHQRR